MMQTGKDSRSSLRFLRLRSWVADRLGDVRHERRVAAIAANLFRLTTEHHNLTADDRRILMMAAIVHDVGRCKDDRNHPTIGAEMILRKEWLPLSPAERRALAYLTRYHRGAVPPAGKDEILKKEDDAGKMRTILAFLRLADALDCRSLASPKLAFDLRNTKLRISVILNEDSTKARRVFSRRKKVRLIEEVLGLRVDVEIPAGRKLKAVA